MRRKHLTVALSAEEYRALGELADKEERTPQQQAVFFLRGVLREKTKEPGEHEL